MSLTHLGGFRLNSGEYIAQYIDTKTDAVHFISYDKAPVIENSVLKFNSSCECFDKDGKEIGYFWGYPNFVFKFMDGTEIADLYSGDYIRSERLIAKHILENK